MLTPPQQAILKAAIAADGALNTLPAGSDSADAIANAFNFPASPPFIVWRTSVSLGDIQGDSAFDWTLVDNLSVGKARIWEWMFRMNAAINPSLANVRAGISACFIGSAPLAAVAAAAMTRCKRDATRFEKLFAAGTGNAASPAVMALEGIVSRQDVQDARES